MCCLYYCLQLEEGSLHLIFSIIVMIIHNLKGCIKTRVLCLFFFLLMFIRIYGSWHTFGIKLITLCMICINDYFIKYWSIVKLFGGGGLTLFLQKGFLDSCQLLMFSCISLLDLNRINLFRTTDCKLLSYSLERNPKLCFNLFGKVLDP